MNISEDTLLRIRRTLNCFENGRIENDYSSIYIYHDGPNDRRQITIGVGITQYGNMKRLVQLYIANNGKFKNDFQFYVARIGNLNDSLVDDKKFIKLLITASKEDQIFRDAEDVVFKEKYFDPAMKFCDDGKLVLPLSLMTVMDSTLQSGSILSFLRTRFPERLPVAGGSEKKWISEYVDVRHDWLATHSRTILRGTIYRTQCLKNQIKTDNWDFLPTITANGVKITE